jgi:hypothetical protein
VDDLLKEGKALVANIHRLLATRSRTDAGPVCAATKATFGPPEHIQLSSVVSSKTKPNVRLRPKL